MTPMTLSRDADSHRTASGDLAATMAGDRAARPRGGDRRWRWPRPKPKERRCARPPPRCARRRTRSSPPTPTTWPRPSAPASAARCSTGWRSTRSGSKRSRRGWRTSPTLPDPVGRVLAEWTRPNGLKISRRPRAARRHRHHLREPAQRDRRRRRPRAQVRQCRDPARRLGELPFLARAGRGAARRAARRRPAGRRDPARADRATARRSA